MLLANSETCLDIQPIQCCSWQQSWDIFKIVLYSWMTAMPDKIFLNINTSYTRYCNICHEMNWNHLLWTIMFCFVVVYLDGVLFCHCESYITSFSSFGSDRVAVCSRVWHVFTFILLFLVVLWRDKVTFPCVYLTC